MIRLPMEEAVGVMKEKLMQHGCSGQKAEKTAYEMARNSLEGTYTHGINRFARLICNIDEGIVNPEAEPELMRVFGGLANVDGHMGLGIPNACFAMETAISLAKDHGVGVVGLRNTNHWMRAATYGLQACSAGMAGICFTNTMPNMPTWGAVDSRIGNNPIVFAFPRAAGDLVVDMAMSQFSYGALELARLQNRQMPVDAGFDRQGSLTRDPGQVIQSQRILPAGYWKGAALSFLLDVFAAAISMGNSVCRIGNLPGDEHGVSQLFLAIHYQTIASNQEIEGIVEEAVEDLLASKRDEHTDRIIYTGQKIQEIREENQALGIPTDEGVWNEILGL